MRVAFSGDRNWTNEDLVKKVLEQLPDKTHIIVGDARGLDTIVYDQVKDDPRFTYCRYFAPWKEMGKRAGHYRNGLMLADKPDLVIAFHNDLENSKGTKNMVAQARKLGIEVQLITENG